MQHNLKNKKLCIFGLSFKKNTDDLRESSAMYSLSDIDLFVANYSLRGLSYRSTIRWATWTNSFQNSSIKDCGKNNINKELR